MSNINKAAVLIPFSDLTAKEHSDRLTAIDANVASTLATQKSEVAAAIAQVNLTQSQAITALTLEVSNLSTDLTDSITATQTELINRADQLAQDVTNITVQLTQDKATFTQEIQDALGYLQDEASTASAPRTPRKIQGVDFDGTQDISLPTFTAETDGLVPKRVGATTTKYLCEDGTWAVPPDTTYALLTKASAEDGTATAANTISAQVLKEAIQYHAPTVTNIVGNAETATKLQTPRTINGVNFDGTTNITTISWGTDRTFTIGSTGKPVNGSANVAWTADEILPTGTQGQVLKHNGTSWVSSTDSNPTYTAMSAVEADTGTETTERVITAATLKGAIQTHAPAQTSVTGNAGSATKLATGRTINGVLFDGTQNISLPEAVAYSLPTASDSVLGGIKVGSGLAIANSVLSVGTLNQSTTGNAATASKLQTARTISLTGKVTGSVSFDGSNNASISTAITGLGVANGIATLDSNGQVPSTQLPSYAGGGVSSVAGKTGVVTLSKADVGLDNVDNTPDAQKPISTATQAALNTKLNATNNAVSASKLATARTINGVAFDGTANITTPTATETVAGIAKIATTAIAQAGTNDTDIITALKLKQAFTSQHSYTGWEKLPDGLIIQWGLAAVGTTTPFPIAFPTACYQVAVSYSSASTVNMLFQHQSIVATRTGVIMFSGGVQNSYIAIGK